MSPPPPSQILAPFVQSTDCFRNVEQIKQSSTKPASKSKIQKQQPTAKLNDGHLMPMIGLGTWNAQGAELKKAVKEAIYYGYRHIDTASNYRNESVVGEAIAECLEEGVLRREDLFVTTKLWNNSHSRGSVKLALEKSLENLQLDYVDLYLIHYPIGYLEGETLSPTDAGGQVITSDVDYVETWLGMEDVKRIGLSKSIGVSNFNSEQVKRILKNCSIIPTINQIESHPYLGQEKLIEFCSKNKILITAYSPLGSPGRIDPRLQEPYLIEDPVVTEMASKYNRPAANILIRYQLERNVIVVPKAIRVSHIKSNLEALEFELSEDDMWKLKSLDRNYRFMKFERCLNHKYYPFSLDESKNNIG